MATKALRADAARNRAALISEARAVFAAEGLDASLDEIARRSGLASATLYRRFVTRESLIEAVFVDQVEDLVAVVGAGLADANAWRGLESVVKALAQVQARDLGLSEVLTTGARGVSKLEDHRSDVLLGLTRLVDRARLSGLLRADAVAQDVLVLLAANANLARRPPGLTVDASARLVELGLDGLRRSCEEPCCAPHRLRHRSSSSEPANLSPTKHSQPRG